MPGDRVIAATVWPSPADALARLDQISRVPRGFPHDFLAAADYTGGGMTARLHLPPGRARHG